MDDVINERDRFHHQWMLYEVKDHLMNRLLKLSSAIGDDKLRIVVPMAEMVMKYELLLYIKVLALVGLRKRLCLVK